MSGDQISRQAAIELVQKYHGKMPNEINHQMWKEANDLPSTQQWIPCKERKPEKSGEYWATLIDEEGTFTDMVSWSATAGGRWEAVFEDEGSYSEIGNVIAWMPLPEPYKGEKNEF